MENIIIPPLEVNPTTASWGKIMKKLIDKNYHLIPPKQTIRGQIAEINIMVIMVTLKDPQDPQMISWQIHPCQTQL